jgi:cryptochrome
MKRSLLWLRKGLRMHDNPALVAAATQAEALFPVFIFDPVFTQPQPDESAIDSATGAGRVNALQFQFLLECLADLDKSLRAHNSRLIVAHGSPHEVMPQLWKQWDINTLAFEVSTEPYAREVGYR